tara:strand:+ start:462 stop:1199 length:738 start_codon:yes stop_codon:yes gene_type:complete
LDKVSVVIITLNEENNIERCLKSVTWADEIVILDAFSQDRTVEICRQYTDLVFQEKWLGFGKQKNLAAEKASNRWILNLDADELISEKCSLAIRRELASGHKCEVYRFPRKNFFGDRWIRFGGWYPDWTYRLYDKNCVVFSESKVHERLEPVTKSGSINCPIEHYSYKSLEEYVSRQNKYSTFSAEEKLKRGQIAGWSDLLFRPPAAFIKTYFLQKGYREGFLGFCLSSSSAFYTFLKYAKTRFH